jgi:hypothetical protein
MGGTKTSQLAGQKQFNKSQHPSERFPDQLAELQAHLSEGLSTNPLASELHRLLTADRLLQQVEALAALGAFIFPLTCAVDILITFVLPAEKLVKKTADASFANDVVVRVVISLLFAIESKQLKRLCLNVLLALASIAPTVVAPRLVGAMTPHSPLSALPSVNVIRGQTLVFDSDMLFPLLTECTWSALQTMATIIQCHADGGADGAASEAAAKLVLPLCRRIRSFGSDSAAAAESLPPLALFSVRSCCSALVKVLCAPTAGRDVVLACGVSLTMLVHAAAPPSLGVLLASAGGMSTPAGNSAALVLGDMPPLPPLAALSVLRGILSAAPAAALSALPGLSYVLPPRSLPPACSFSGRPSDVMAGLLAAVLGHCRACSESFVRMFSFQTLSFWLAAARAHIAAADSAVRAAPGLVQPFLRLTGGLRCWTLWWLSLARCSHCCGISGTMHSEASVSRCAMRSVLCWACCRPPLQPVLTRAARLCCARSWPGSLRWIGPAR